MLTSTLRARLTLWYAAASATVLLLFSLGVYSLFAKTLHDRLDSHLRSAAQVTQLSLNHEIEEHGGRKEGEESMREVLRTMFETSFPRTAIAVWDGNRLVVEKQGGAGVEARDLPALTHQRGSSSIHTFTTPRGKYRIAAADIHVPFVNARYQITANEALADVEDELANLRYVLLISVPFCVLLAAAGGYFLARQNLRPVAEMARTVEDISSANLEQRLTIYKKADELGQLGETFNRLLDRIEQAFGQQRRFMADASHELRTPLSVALTTAQVTLQRDREKEDLREALLLIEEQLRRLKRVVEDMFTLAQVDAGAYKPSLTPVYLDDLAREALRAARVLAKPKGIDVSLRHAEGEFDFECDEGLIRQLMLNLLDNAVKYTPPGGAVEFSLESNTRGYILEVSDTGPGIAPADLPHIFDRFYRSDRARSRRDPGAGSGAGLGLSIAKWIAELHGGSISVAASAGGSRFRIDLPYQHHGAAKSLSSV